jgi:hypothetical protein
VIGVVILCQLAFLLAGCDWDLSGDEAEFWEWSRHLDWSYFARGPLIAWLIRLSTETIGGLSLRLTGSLMFAARVPASILGGLTAWGIFRLASLTTGSRRSALVTILLLPAIPALMLGGVLMTCDTPLMCLWTWSAVWVYRALHSDMPRAWVVAGLLGALGVLAKYTMLAFPAAVGLFLSLSAPHRRQLTRPWFWVMCLLTVVLGLAPIVAWNARHDWVAYGQLAGRMGLSSPANWGSVGSVLAFFGGDIAALGGIWWIAGLVALLATFSRVVGSQRTTRRPIAPSDSKDRSVTAGLLFLLCLWGVIWTACFATSLLGETEANWMVPGYVSLLILIGMRVDEALAARGARAKLYIACWCVSVAGVVAIHHTEWFYPAIARWVPASTKRWPAPLRLYDPTCRLRGHKLLADEVSKRLAKLEAERSSPFVLTATYALTSTLSFYLPGRPETYCLGWNYGMTPDPVNQHDLWHPNPRHEQAAFRGRAAIIVDDSNMPPDFANQMMAKGVFGHMDSIDRIFARDHGVVVGAWDIAVVRDYKGLAGYKQAPRRKARR